MFDGRQNHEYTDIWLVLLDHNRNDSKLVIIVKLFEDDQRSLNRPQIENWLNDFNYISVMCQIGIKPECIHLKDPNRFIGYLM